VKSVATRGSVADAALRLFAERGYFATSMRDIAAAVGTNPGSLYHHIRSKDELLCSLLVSSVNERLAALTEATTSIDDPVARFRVGVDTIIRHRATRQSEILVGQSELRALHARKRREVIAVRDQYEEAIGRLLDHGVARRVFDVRDRKLTIFAIIAVAQQVGRWYRPNGRLSLDQISRFYQDLLLASIVRRDDVGVQSREGE
jgi:AcrR family transcriptional regulator